MTNDAKPDYEHLQMGYGILAMGLAAEFGLLLSCARFGTWTAGILFSLILSFLQACFLFLKVTVDAEEIRLVFGIRLIKTAVPIAEIRSCEIIRTFALAGWGVRSIGRHDGWSYSVSGWRAVELGLESGRKIRIGTDDPENLAAAIRRRMR